MSMPKRRVTKVCPVCGVEFETGGRAGRWDKRFCSSQCSGIAQREPDKCLHSAGYRYVTVSTGKRMLEHRMVAEQMLGRPLMDTEIVHHLNGDKLNNRPENLIVMSQACHRALIDHLARLWVIEHLADNGRVTKEVRDFEFTYELTVNSGG